MRTIFSRLFSRSVPVVCGDCDEGTGSTFDASTGILSICATCRGTGKPVQLHVATPNAPGVIDLDVVRQARAKAQHEARKVA